MGERSIGRFHIEGEAASGSAGTVYQAVDQGTGERVALKIIRGLSVADKARFVREARLLAKVRHPGVVRYVDHGVTDEGNPFLVMEWLEGEDVRRRLARAGLSIDETVALGLRVVDALAAIHELGVVHRDIKPANIFLPAGLVEEAKILDFGLVHTEWASADVTKTGMVVGTPSYMAPEQARGQREIDARADIFSLGCVLFKCLAGSPPFEGNSVLAVLTKVLLEEAPRLRHLRPEVPPALEELVMQMIRKDPTQRPTSAAAVAEVLAGLSPVGAAGAGDAPPPSSVLSGLTAGEQRVSSVLLVGAVAAQPGAPAEVRFAESTQMSADMTVPTAPLPSDIGVIVEEYGGQLDTLLDGTRVVTLAAAGVATDQVARAARCALALRAAAPEAAIAIATGRTEVARQRTTGDAIDRAALLLAACHDRASQVDTGISAARAAGAIVIDELTAALLDARFQVETGEGGLRLVGMRFVEAGSRTLLGRATTMVGRDWELGSIESIFRTCVEEREARPVLVTGAPGMGKSRLAAEAVASLRRAIPGVEVWWGRGDPLRAGSALGLLGQVIRSAFSHREGDSPENQRRRFVEQVTSLAVCGLPSSSSPSVEAPKPPPQAPPVFPPSPVPPASSEGGPPSHAWVAEVLGEIAGVPSPDEESPALRAARMEPRTMSESLRAAWEAVVAGACAVGPLIVVLEDLQWADAATVRFVGTALASLERQPWLVLALARPEVYSVFPRLWEGRDLQEIRLAPLTRRAGERLAREVLGDTVSFDTLQRVAAQSDGNAFYLEELIRAVADVRRRRSSRPPVARAQSSPISALPETVLAMVQARLEGLDAGTRRVLRAASVFGEVFWVGGVASLLGGAVEPMGEPSSPTYPWWVDVLLDRELVVARAESRFAGERELAFRHALLREGAYAMLTESDRVLGHALAGAWLEKQRESDPMVLAQHFELALDAERASSLYRTASLSAMRAGDIEAGLARAHRALSHAPTEDARIECLSLLCDAYAWRDDEVHAMSSADEVIALASPGSEPWIHAMMVKQRMALLLGRPDEIDTTVAALCALEVPGGGSSLTPGAANALAQALIGTMFHVAFGARYEAASQILAKLATLAATGFDVLTLSSLEIGRSWDAAWHRGDAWSAFQHACRSVLHAERSRDARHLRLAQLYVATSEWALGLHAEAEADLRAILRSAASDAVASAAERFLALVLVDSGDRDRERFDEARSIAQSRVDAARADPQTWAALREAEGRWLLGEVAAGVADFETAEREIAAALPVLRSVALLWQTAAARLVEVRLALGIVAEALATAREVAAALAASGGHGLRGTLVRLVHAEALHAAGEIDAAHAVLSDARIELSARAALIEDADVRSRFLEAVPENARVLARAWEWLDSRSS
jgi:tetratricopeptide (TPR) repeat protein